MQKHFVGRTVERVVAYYNFVAFYFTDGTRTILHAVCGRYFSVEFEVCPEADLDHYANEQLR